MLVDDEAAQIARGLLEESGRALDEASCSALYAAMCRLAAIVALLAVIGATLAEVAWLMSAGLLLAFVLAMLGESYARRCDKLIALAWSNNYRAETLYFRAALEAMEKNDAPT